MSRQTLQEWLAERAPAVPEELLPVLLRYDRGGGQTYEELASAGGDAIETTLAKPGRDRAGAHALLAGDAYLTYACEVIVEGDQDVGEALTTLVQRLGRRFP